MDFCISEVSNKGFNKVYQNHKTLGAKHISWVSSKGIKVAESQGSIKSQRLTIGWLKGPLKDSQLSSRAQIGREALSSNGSFAVVHVLENKITVVTDAGGSIPIYYGIGPRGVTVGTLVQHVAQSSGLTKIDNVSVVDFLLNETICFPYSWFEGVRKASPGSVIEISSQDVRTYPYWKPNEPENVMTESKQSTKKKWGESLRRVIGEGLKSGIGKKEQIKILFSGGTDSRAVTSLLPDKASYQPKVILDYKNREYKLAKWASQALGYHLEWVKRPKQYYQSNIQGRVRSVGPGYDIRHMHVSGELLPSFEQADGLVGGFAADTLFKGLYMSNIKTQRLRRDTLGRATPDTIKRLSFDKSYLFQSDLVSAVRSRRRDHHEALKEMRPQTAGHWHFLWPISNMMEYTHYLACLRIGPRVIEPFLTHDAYRLAASMPEDLRVDKKAFRYAFVEPMGSAAWLPDTAGRILGLPGIVGKLFTSIYWRIIRLYSKMSSVRKKGQGPWGEGQSGWEITTPQNHISETGYQRLKQQCESLFSKECDEYFGGNTALPLDMQLRLLTLGV